MSFLKYKEEFLNTNNWDENYFVIGIDLGTTNSVISYYKFDIKKPEAIDMSGGFSKIPLPSVVQLRDTDNEDEWLIGEEALRSMKIYPESTIHSVKRKMGTNETVEISGKTYKPEEISAKILETLLIHIKEINPNAELAGVVVSIPYGFSDSGKKATIKACEIAGISENLICLIEEPKAAALYYNSQHDLKKGEKIMIFDFGGGTLDITIFNVSEKTDDKMVLTVISQGGDAFHGGDNIDDLLMDFCISKIEAKTSVTKDSIALENICELQMRVREAKERLSGVTKFRIPFTFCVPPFVENITRDEFHKIIEPFIEKTREYVLKTLSEAYEGPLKAGDIDKIILEGGSSSMPWIKAMLTDIFSDDRKIFQSEKPALDISLGACYYAAMKMGLYKNLDLDNNSLNLVFDVTVPHDIGVEVLKDGVLEFSPVIFRGTPYSLSKKHKNFTLTGETEEDMERFTLKILERIHKHDTLSQCSLIGELEISGLPKRPIGKTNLKVTLSVMEDGGLVIGKIEDMGFMPEFLPSGININFTPDKFHKTILEG